MIDKKKYLAVLTLAACIMTTTANGQTVMLDESVRAGDLTLFRSQRNASEYHYVPAQIRLARDDATGLPKFSFLHFTPDVAVKGRSSATEALSGGIVHAVVELSVSQEQRREAERELGRLVPGGKLVGPANFHAGKFALVTSFQGEQNRVIGLGNAPLLEGSRASVSLRLPKDEALVLWESFKTATPDISFKFEMELKGYASPFSAQIDVDWERIRTDETLGVAVATPVLGAEIRKAFDDLCEKRVIRIKQTGDDEESKRRIDLVYERLLAMLFEPITQNTSSSLADATIGQQRSLLDSATENLNLRRSETAQRNAQIRTENDRQQREWLARRQLEAARSGSPGNATGRLPDGIANGKPGTPSLPGTSLAQRRRGISPPTRFLQAFGGSYQDASPKMRAEESLPKFSALAVYRKKKWRMRQEIRLEISKHGVETRQLRFDRNVGNLSRFQGDARIFRQSYLQPLDRTRQIHIALDGATARLMEKHLNSVSGRIIKRHGNGEESVIPFSLNRRDFAENGGVATVAYSWKKDRAEDWPSYEVEYVWSLAGGDRVEVSRHEISDNALVLHPPYQLRTVRVESHPARLDEQNIRFVHVSIYSQIEGRTRRMQHAISVDSSEKFGGELTFLAPDRQDEYEYDIAWVLEDGTRLSTDRLRGTDTVLPVDKLPKEAANE